jgi:hypothetical protein
MKRVNNWLAVKITEMVGTMWCAYIFVCLAILGFPYGSDRLPDYVQWVSQTFIQLVMLSVIMVGQNLITDKQDKHDEKLNAHSEKLDAVHSHLGIGDENNA